MYQYVTDREFLQEVRRLCSQMMCELRGRLQKEKITVQEVLVGSGARNLITQNGKGPIDFDYNLRIVSYPDINNCRELKDTVRKCFNYVLNRHGYPDCDDSTSVLSSKVIYRKKHKIGFQVDVCITYEKNEQWYRLIHEKGSSGPAADRWYWNPCREMYGYGEKAAHIKKVPGAWMKLRERYVERKNRYLSRGDNDHPSLVCYIEVVNEVYEEVKRKGNYVNR